MRIILSSNELKSIFHTYLTEVTTPQSQTQNPIEINCVDLNEDDDEIIITLEGEF